ncbi:two-component regulator propeller domain-containing protein [Emticicia sp. SJ17W-69]|uniref:ligand-binding sensor domain-containing protein n=1 Tax=Emticicia sp. SJ17W-69 TaxID=3421657 RepID=UPI003EBD348A
MTQICIKSIFFLLILLFSNKIQAQNLTFNKITTKNGLSSNNVLGITKDTQGFLWLATNLGVSRYDGYQFQTFGAISSPNGLAISKDGILWFSNEKGLFSLNTKSMILTLKISNILSDNIPDNDHYNGVFVDRQGVVWSTDFHHIKSYDPQNKHLTYYKVLNENQQNPNLAKFVEDSENNLWSVSPLGLARFDKNRKKWITYLAEKNLLSLTFDTNTQTLWLGNQHGELLNFNPRSKTLLKKYSMNESVEQIQFLNKQYLMCISHNTLFLFDIYKKNFEKIENIEEDITLNTFFIDKQKTELWLGTNEGLMKKEAINQLIRQVLIPKNILSYPASVRCFEVEDEQNFLLGMSSGDVLRWNKTSNKFTKITQLPSTEISTIKVVKNNIYIGSNKSLIVKKQGGIIEKLLSHGVNDIELDDQNRLWILAPNQPIIVFDFNKKEFIKPWKKNPNPIFFKENLFLKLQFTSDKKMWLAGWIPSGFGIACFDLKTNEFQELSSINDHKRFVTDYYLDVSSTPKGDLLFSGYGGFNRLNAKGIIVDEVHAEELKPIFADGQCFAIAEDQNGNTWIGTAEGLICISKDKQINRFTQFDGLLNNDIRNGFLMTKNELFLGHKRGFSILNLENVGIKNISNQLQLSRVNILGTQYQVDLSKTLVFSRQQNNLSFAFSPLNFENQAQNKFRYRLTAMNEKWIENGVNPTITFSNLKQGEYELEVQYAEIASSWNTNTLKIKFEILPAWYETLWFKILLGLILIGLVNGIYWYRLNEFKKIQAIRNRISSDLHDEIGTSLSSIGILGGLVIQKLGENHPSFTYAEMISEEAKQAGTAIDYIIWNINPQFDNLESLFTRINSEAAELIEAKGIQYEYEAHNLDNKSMSMEKKRNVYLICKELINNALKHSQCTIIALRCRLKANQLEILFSDNGRGFDINLPSNRNGVKNVKTRVQELKGTCEIKSETGNGTRYELKIPLR